MKNNGISRMAIAAIIIVILVVAIGGGYYYYYYQQQQAAQKVVVIYADYSANVAQPYFNNFTADTGIKVVPLYASMGELVGKLVASKSSPVADVLFGGAPSAYIGADQQGVLMSYKPPATQSDPTYLAEKAFYAPDWTWYSFTYNILGIIINTKVQQEYNLPTPENWSALLNPVYKGHIIIENPSTSTTTGLGFFSLILQMYISQYGVQQGEVYFQNYVKNFFKNVIPPITADDEDAETVIGQGTGGITIDWINAAPLYKELNGYPLEAIVVPDNILGPTAMGIVNGAPHLKAAETYINWVFSYQGQSLIPKVFLKPAIMYNNITPPEYFPTLQEEEQLAFQYNQSFTVQYSNYIDSVFNNYSSTVSSSASLMNVYPVSESMATFKPSHSASTFFYVGLPSHESVTLQLIGWLLSASVTSTFFSIVQPLNTIFSTMVLPLSLAAAALMGGIIYILSKTKLLRRL